MSHQRIRVDIAKSDFWTMGNPVHRHLHVLKRLQDSGIPVSGGLQIESVERGRLTMWETLKRDGKYLSFEWTHNDEDDL